MNNKYKRFVNKEKDVDAISKKIESPEPTYLRRRLTANSKTMAAMMKDKEHLVSNFTPLYS